MARLAAVLAVVLALGQAAGAAPSLQGFTGLMRVPNADTLNNHEFNLAWFNIDLAGGNENVYALNVGVRDGLEVGVLRTAVHRSDRETVLSAKYQVQSESEQHPALAIGVLDPTDQLQSTVYVVGSKVVAGRARVFNHEITSLRACLGVGGGQLDGVFAGLSAGLGDRLLLMAEYDSHDTNVGARADLGYGIRGHVGWLHDLDDLAVGVSYSRQF